MNRRATLASAGVALWLTLTVAPTADHHAADLPERLTHEEFWQLSADLSEPGASFISDNLVSNEMSFAQVIPEIGAWGVKGGVYLGVGPEQNFTYLEAMRARMGFILDIRRENLLLHLLYKALFDVSPTRADFLSKLFARPAIEAPSPEANARTLMEALAQAPQGTVAEQQAGIDDVIRVLGGFGYPLTAADLATIKTIQQAFHQYGPDISYSTTLLKHPFGTATYANLMQQVDADGRELGFLASEQAYQFVRHLQQRNLVVPVVGNFAGVQALREIGRYLRDRGATVSAFYVSNVEDYLGRERMVPPNGKWSTFCENAASLPLDQHSVFIRPLGLAVFDASGRMSVSKDMHIISNEAVVHSQGIPGDLPRALSAIVPEVRQCQ